MDPKLARFETSLKRLERKHGHFTWEAAFADLVVIIGHVQLGV